MPNSQIATQFQDTAFNSELAPSVGVWRNEILLLSRRLKLNTLATLTVKEVMWIQNFWTEISGKSIINPTLLKADNQGAIELLNNNKFHTRTKHINVRYHFIHEVIENKFLDIQYVPTDENIVDIFTKALARPLFEKFRGMLGLCYAWGGVLRLEQVCYVFMNNFLLNSFFFLLYHFINSAIMPYSSA